MYGGLYRVALGIKNFGVDIQFSPLIRLGLFLKEVALSGQAE
jgi:hypothetical protein